MFQIASVSTEFQCQLRSESWSNLNDTYGENVPQRKISILLKGLRTHVLQPLTKVTQWGRNYCNTRSPMTLTVILRPKKKLIKSQKLHGIIWQRSAGFRNWNLLIDVSEVTKIKRVTHTKLNLICYDRKHSRKLLCWRTENYEDRETSEGVFLKFNYRHESTKEKEKISSPDRACINVNRVKHR